MKIFFLSLIFIFYTSQLLAVEKIHQLIVVSEELEELSQTDGSGLYFDLVRKIYEPLGIKVKFIISPYIRSVTSVKLKKADFWLGSYINEEDFAIYPRYAYDFDEVAALYNPVLFPQFKDITSLSGKNVAWIRGYNYDRHLPVKMIKHQRNNRRTAFLSLQAGRFDIFLDDFDDMFAEIENKNPDMQAYQVKKIAKLFLFPAFRGDERGEKLRKIWDTRMQEIQKNGEFSALFLSYEYSIEEINQVIKANF